MVRSYRRHGLLPAVLLAGLAVGCGDSGFVDRSALVDAILNDAGSYFFLDIEGYPAGDRTLPIGMFDSGTGGLTVLDAIVRYDAHDNETHAGGRGDGVRDFGKESFIYLADQANMPYGVYGREGRAGLLREHILKDVQFLLGDRYYRTPEDMAYRSDKSPVKAIVIACNTATAYGMGDIEAFLGKAGLDVPVIGVIDAGVRGALDTFGEEEKGTIAVFATVGTVSSRGYPRTFHDLKEETGVSGDVVMVQQAGLGIASAIDGVPEYILPGAPEPRDGYEGPSDTHPEARIEMTMLPRYDFAWEDGEMLFDGPPASPGNLQINSVRNYIAYHAVSLMERMRRSENARPLKTVILGCTHYPFYADVFREEFRRLREYREEGLYVYRHLLEEEIVLIDPAENTASELYEYLREERLFSDGDLCRSEFYISRPNGTNENVETDASGHFSFAYKYGRREGRVQEYVKRVPFSRASIPGDVVERLRTAMPGVYGLMVCFHRGNEKMAYLEESNGF